MKEPSIFSQWWFWLLIIGIILLLVAAFLHLGLKENTEWAWWIFIAGAVLAVIGIIGSFVVLARSPKCTEYVAAASSDASSSAAVAETKPLESSSIQAPAEYQISTPSYTDLNFPQAERGFTATSQSLDSLAMSP